MTNIGSLVLILVCIGIGYILEPIFFSDSNQSPLAPKPAPEQVETGAEDESLKPPAPTPVPTPPKDEGLQFDLSKITPADFPEKVTLKVPYTLSDEASGVTMQLKEGAKVQPVRLEEGLLVFRLGGLPIEGKTEVDNTDFKTLAAPILIKRLQDAVGNQESGGDDRMAGDSSAEPAPDPVVVPDPIPVPDPEPVVEPEPVVDAQPDPAPDAGKEVVPAAIVDLMKASVADGKVTEFEASQVTSWKAGSSMEFDGKTYQTGLVTFKAETILGMQEHDAIALIENGAVVKWMWAKTKLEMR